MSKVNNKSESETASVQQFAGWAAPIRNEKPVSFGSLSKKISRTVAYLPYPAELLAMQLRTSMTEAFKVNPKASLSYKFPAPLSNADVASCIGKLKDNFGVEGIDEYTVVITPPVGVLETADAKAGKK